MARLILSLDNQVLAEYNMTKERYTIGRLPDNDIRIDNAAVSGHHSLIINILNDSFLEDLNSTNGTYVNGKLIKKHALQHGDVITAGHHQLRYVDDQAEEVDAGPDDEFQKTMVIEPNKDMEEQIAKVKTTRETHAATMEKQRQDNAMNEIKLEDEYEYIITLMQQDSSVETLREKLPQALEALEKIKNEYRRFYDESMEETRSFDSGMRALLYSIDQVL